MEKKSPYISVIGNCSVDFVLRLLRMPGPGVRVEGKDFLLRVGGGAVNTAVAATNLGAEASVIARIGSDHFGNLVIKYLEQNDIRSKCIILDELHPTGLAFIIIFPGGERSVIVASNANLALSVADIVGAEETLCQSHAVVIRLTTPETVVRKTVQIALSNDVKTIIVPTPIKNLENDIISGSDLLLMNQVEASTLLGFEVSLDSAMSSVQEILSNFSCNYVVITLGPSGAVFASRYGEGEHIRGLNVKAIDTTGAGEVFCGALAYYWVSSGDIINALHKANIAAAISVTRSGQHRCPTLKELDEFLSI